MVGQLSGSLEVRKKNPCEIGEQHRSLDLENIDRKGKAKSSNPGTVTA